MEIPKEYKAVNIYYFYTEEAKLKKKIIIYVYPFHHERLERYKINTVEDVLKYYPWIVEGRVFVKVKKPKKRNLNIF